MYRLAKVFARNQQSLRAFLTAVSAEITGCPQVDAQSRLFNEESQQSHVQVQEFLRSVVHDLEKLILIIFEIGGSPVGGYHGHLVLLKPRLPVIHLYLRNRQLMCPSFVHDREGQGLHSVGCVEPASVAE